MNPVINNVYYDSSDEERKNPIVYKIGSNRRTFPTVIPEVPVACKTSKSEEEMHIDTKVSNTSKSLFEKK